MNAPRYASRLVPALVLAALVAACTHHAIAGGFGGAQGPGQPADADLTALAAISGVRGDVIYYGASGWTRLAKGTATHVLTQGANDPAWSAAAAAGGDVAGPASSVDNEIVRFDSTTGKLVQRSAGVTISDTGVISWPSGLGPTLKHLTGPPDQQLNIVSEGSVGDINITAADTVVITGSRDGGGTGVEIYGNNGGAIELYTDGGSVVLDASGALKIGVFTVATLPAATTAGQIIYVSNGAAGAPVLAFSNGTNWLRCDTLAAVSAT